MNIQSPQCIFRGKVTKRTQPPHMDIINQLHQIRARNWTLNEPHMFKIWKFLGHLKTSFNSQNSMKHLRRSRLLIGNNLQFFLRSVKDWNWMGPSQSKTLILKKHFGPIPQLSPYAPRMPVPRWPTIISLAVSKIFFQMLLTPPA